jgi:hypothetical protein
MSAPQPDVMLHARSHPAATIQFCVVSSQTDLAGFNILLSEPAFADVESYPHTGAFGRAYHRAIHGNLDCSFAICTGSTAVLLCLCAPLNGKLGFYGMPLRLIARPGMGSEVYQPALSRAFEQLHEAAAQQGVVEIVVQEPAGSAGYAVREIFRCMDATAKKVRMARVDLTAGPVAWRRALRKSSRSLINWGRRNLAISYVNKKQPDRRLFEQYREFHAETAGRITRAPASWDVMYEWIAQGGGELVMAFHYERLVGGTMFIDGNNTSIYASGVYDRALFDKPLAHYPVWLGIERAQARGMADLELGEVPDEGTVSDKEYRIGYFKRGFATHLDEQVVWRRPLAAPQT